MNTRKSVNLGFLMAVGILLQLIESFVPIVMIVPGFKIGLANLASLFALMIYDKKSMWIIGIGRIFLSALLQGTLFSVAFWLSLSGGLLSLIAMSIAADVKVFSIYGISILGAAFHSVGQVIAVTWIYQQYFMQLFLPILLALSIVSGLVVAILSQKMLDRLKGRIVS
ncbi:MAG: Gx transporter family protein [Absicoccus porci]|uniref:Gx transporter family protein n=1 Tax=Absicoccus porci TaxID=2486576 RepID=UPI00235547F3|nr:Gx transporter family protein [Absicoccus porci]MCI6088201.1 Gx transporter family protein [Absicoccus porci]MDD7330151.1 Gx transporter family protein [Absicoccus porci]MDY4739063.1 Gx transporter family protein [Absicoccus porci]